MGSNEGGCQKYTILLKSIPMPVDQTDILVKSATD